MQAGRRHDSEPCDSDGLLLKKVSSVDRPSTDKPITKKLGRAAGAAGVTVRGVRQVRTR